MSTIMVGIDPGVSTGYAEWDRVDRKLIRCETVMIHRAWERVLYLRAMSQLHSVVFEDARLRTWFGSAGREKLQGAGSVKRDCKAWADFCGDHGIPYLCIAPQKGATKWDESRFKTVTKWGGKRTSEHARDAALLVFGRGA